MTDEVDTCIGVRLKTLRTARGLTLERLARLCGLTRGYLSLVERGRKTPSLAALLRMADALGTDPGALFGAAPQAARPDFVLYRHRAVHDGIGRRVVPLAPERSGKSMEPFIVRPTALEVEWASHPGEELIVVLSGDVLVRIDLDDMLLHPGDSLYFSAARPHSIRRLGAAPAEVLVVVGRGNRDGT